MKMRFFFILPIFAFSSLPALAADKGNDAPVTMQQQSEQCLETQNCSLQLNLELLKEMHVKSGTLLASVIQGCHKDAGTECLDLTRINEWQVLNQKSKDLMDIITKSTTIAEQSKSQDK